MFQVDFHTFRKMWNDLLENLQFLKYFKAMYSNIND